MKNLAELLEDRAATYGDKAAYIFLASDESESKRISYAQLRDLARAYGIYLQKKIFLGDRVLLILPDEDLFLPVFWGCQYAGAVAVPTPAMDVRSAARMVPRLKSILASAESRYIVTTRAIRQAMLETLKEDRLGDVEWFLVDDISTDPVDLNTLKLSANQDSVAVLQYTSGSTSAPKGIMLSHGNLLDNLSIIDEFIELYCPQKEGRVCVTWLPYFHDMGLIGTMLQPIYSGYETVIMKPLDFLQRPLRWLRMISKYRAICMTAPNFAYEICRKKATDEDVKALDLSCWKMAMNGSETIRWDSLSKFAAKFAPAGFKVEAFAPVYGLAESTLFVTGVAPGNMSTKNVSLKSLQGRQPEFVPEGSPKSIPVVGCGSAIRQDLRIVDPEKGTEVRPGEIGEIWIAGKSIAGGYWKLKEESQKTFGAKLESQPDKNYLRTGDLAFVMEGHLYFAGRIKDLIIVNGKNHYPQDIEHTAEQAHPMIRAGCSVAFSTDINDEGQIVLVVEAKIPPRSGELKTVRDIIMRQVATVHGLAIHDVVLIQPGTIFKTSSGKVQRQLTKKMWAKNTLIRLDSMVLSRFWAKLKLLRYVRANY